MKPTIAFVLTALAACSDPAPDAVVDHHPAPPIATATDEVAVVFMTVVFRPFPPALSELHLEVVPANVTGTVPSAFRVALARPPARSSWVPGFSFSLFPDGELDPIFVQPRAPNAVAIGQLAVGPASELAALPASIPFDYYNTRTMGELIAPYLPHTTLTGYQVIDADGVTDAAIYPTLASGGTDGQPIANGVTLVDARAYTAGIAWQLCADEPLGATLATPAYAACLADSHALIDCLDHCGTEAACAACRTSFPDQLDRDHCLFTVAQPLLTATCGPERRPAQDQIQILDDDATLAVTPGTDDLRAGLRILHISSEE